MKLLGILLCAILGVAYFQPQWLEAQLTPLIKDKAAPTSSIYSWVGENGEMNFSNSRPSQKGYETLIVDPNVNLIKTAPEFVKPKAKSFREESVETPVFGLDGGKVKQLFEDAKGVQGLMDQRNGDVERAIQRAQ